MSPERAARHIQIGLGTKYMVIASSSFPGTVLAVCPPRCALARHMVRSRPDLVVGVYDRDVAAEDIIEDLRATQGEQVARNSRTLACRRAHNNQDPQEDN